MNDTHSAESMNLTLGKILDRAIENHPDNEAIVYVDRGFRLTYRQFGQMVDQLARGLMALGVQPGRKGSRMGQ